MARRMLKDEAVQEFIAAHQGINMKDRPMVRTAWNNYIDYLVREGRITNSQANTWVNPFVK